LGIDGRFGRVEIFGLIIAEGAAAKGDDFGGIVGDRESDAAAEAVEETIVLLITRDEAGLDEERLFVFCAEMTEERVAAAGSEADAETLDGFRVETAIFKIGAGGTAFGSSFQLFHKICLSFAMNLDK